jgi:hypothetical protein
LSSNSTRTPISKHLLFIAETIPVDGIGSAVIFQRHLRRLADHGWTVHVISHFAVPESPACFWQHTQLPSRQSWWPPVRRHWRPSVWLRTLLERQHLRSTLDALPAQGVVVVTQFWDDISVLAASIAHRRGWPLGAFHHDDEIGWEPDPRLHGYLHWKRAHVAAAAARIWPVSQKLVAQLPPAAQPKCRVLRPLPGSFGIPAPQWSEVEPRGLRLGYAGKIYGAFQPLLRTLADRLAAHGGTLELITDPENARKLHRSQPNVNARPFMENHEAAAWLRANCSALLIAHPLDFSTVSPRWQILRSSFPSKLPEAAQFGLPLLLVAAKESAFGEWALSTPQAPYFPDPASADLDRYLAQLGTREGWQRASGWTQRLATNEFSPSTIHAAWEADLDELVGQDTAAIAR